MTSTVPGHGGQPPSAATDPNALSPLGALWGKSASRGGGRTNLLLQHLLDTGAVAELIWDHYLSPSLRQAVDDIAGFGKGRRFFAWLCGVHDFGKATPAFQHLDDAGAALVLRAGLSWDQRVVRQHRWRHDRAGGYLIRGHLSQAGWSETSIDWVWPLIAGHHGLFPTMGAASGPRARGALKGKGPKWEAARQELLDAFTTALGFDDVASVEPASFPNRAVQLQLSGFVVMADWIASDQEHFQGVDSFAQVSVQGARHRAEQAWKRLGLRGGWGELADPGKDVFRRRFGENPRDSQTVLAEAAAQMGAHGLIVVEAPMGEGKTKAALVAAEVLAARWGMDGVFVGMPTQATCDPMFVNVRSWVDAIAPSLASQVALLHGKRMFNKQWRELFKDEDLRPDDRFTSVDEDEFGLEDPFGASGGPSADVVPERKAPAEWFMGAKRGLLSPFVVGTIDQLLFAATRTKHVMLRMAGLAGKVVVLDEVHAADIYMSQFLAEGLRWLGQAGVPVVLLSATLPPAQRRELMAAYLAGTGAFGTETSGLSAVPEPTGYPSVTAVWRSGQAVRHVVQASRSWRSDLQVAVEILPEPFDEAANASGRSAEDEQVASLLRERLVDGGCALVIRNTVKRAQQTFVSLREEFGDEVRLLHGRLSEPFPAASDGA
nr:CRISPR-associated endonuclease Cas3'' [Actinomadura rifamycini]